MEKYYNIKDELQNTLTSFIMTNLKIYEVCITLVEVYHYYEIINENKHYYLVKRFELRNETGAEVKRISKKDTDISVKTPIVLSSINNEEKEILLNYISSRLHKDIPKNYTHYHISEIVIESIIYLIYEMKKNFYKQLKNWEYEMDIKNV